MRVLGIDPSTKTGLVVIESPQIVLHASEIEFKKQTGLQRASSIIGRIMEVKEEYKPDFAVIEGYGYANTFTLATLVEIGTVIRYFLWQSDFKYHEIAPNALKKFATGKGTSKKAEIMLAVYKKWGFDSPTDNIADAFVLAMMGIAGKCN